MRRSPESSITDLCRNDDQAAVPFITAGCRMGEASPCSFSPNQLEKSWKMADNSSMSAPIRPPGGKR
jgi:hypothetical protein